MMMNHPANSGNDGNDSRNPAARLKKDVHSRFEPEVSV